MANSPAIDWRAIGTGPNPFQSMPILTNPVPIRGHLLMPVSIHSKPIHSQSFIPAQSSQPAKQSQASQQRTTQSQQQFHDNLPSQSDANPSQSNVNFSPIQTALEVHWQCIGLGLAKALPIPGHLREPFV